MEESYSVTNPTGSLTVTWRLCRVGTECPPLLEAWRSAVDICAIDEIIVAVVEEYASESGEELHEALDLARNIILGDLSYLNQSDALKILLNMFEGSFSVAGAGVPANMRDTISNCSALPNNLRNAAMKFVDLYEHVGKLMQQVQESVNRIHCPAPPARPAGPMPPESVP